MPSKLLGIIIYASSREDIEFILELITGKKFILIPSLKIFANTTINFLYFKF